MDRATAIFIHKQLEWSKAHAPNGETYAKMEQAQRELVTEITSQPPYAFVEGWPGDEKPWPTWKEYKIGDVCQIGATTLAICVSVTHDDDDKVTYHFIEGRWHR